MLKRTIKANFDAYNELKEEWKINFHSLTFEVEAETEKELNEKAHKRCESDRKFSWYELPTWERGSRPCLEIMLAKREIDYATERATR